MIQKIKNIVNTQTDEKGFSILEVMFAMVIFTIGVLGIGALQLSAIQGNKTSRGVTEATQATLDIYENMLVQPYAAIGDGNETVGGKYNVNWTVDEDADGVGTKTVVMTVTWDDHGTNKNLTFRQIIPLVDR